MNLPKEKIYFPPKPLCSVTHVEGHAPVKKWDKFVTIEAQALTQLEQTASMPFVKPWVAAMPDTHFGMGATVGSVIPTVGAVMPAAVGVDIGCGMMAVRTNRTWKDLVSQGEFTWRKWMFDQISAAVPHGRTDNGGARDIGAWPENNIPGDITGIFFKEFAAQIDELGKTHPNAVSRNAERHLGTLGTGNHFIEVCVEIDNPDSNLWVVIHSGSRGFGNKIGSYFTRLAGQLCEKWHAKLPNRDLGFLPFGTQEYLDYLTALTLAQKYAWRNREIMMARVLSAIGAEQDTTSDVPSQVHMHHNYADIHGDVVLTRKGAVDASRGKWVIIPGSMGAKTYIARGLGSKESFNSCSHGAGRSMSRTEALKKFSVDDHVKATEGVYCDKTQGVLDETPGAYKDIDAVMASQADLVEPILKLKQIVCVKGLSD